MTELEQLRADLATLRKAAQVSSDLGFPAVTVGIKTICGLAEKKVADIEAQQAPEDEWWAVKDMIGKFSDDYDLKKYVRHLESKVAELENELRCERIDGGKVRDDQKAIDAAKNRAKNREKLAELTTIANAIPPACGIFFYSEQFRETLELARELVKRRIEGIKRDMQGNGN